MRISLTASLAATIASFPLPVFADAGSTGPSMAMVALRAALSLAGVIALIGALALLLRRLHAHASSRPAGGRLRSLARLDLGARREIRLVEADGRRLLVGVTSERVELLTSLGTADPGEEELPAELRVVSGLTTSS